MNIFNRNPANAATDTHTAGNGRAGVIQNGVEPENRRFSKRPAVLSFASLSKRSSGTGTPPGTPSTNQSKQFGAASVEPSGRVDTSSLSDFSLRLNELVNKAFVRTNASTLVMAPLTGTSPFTGQAISAPRTQSITYGSTMLPDRVKVIELTRTMIDELHRAALVDPYLLRAVSRAVLKSTSQFVMRIESLLVSAQRDPSALSIPTSPRGAQHLSAAMEFNLALMSLEWIVEESLERCLEGLPPLALLHSPGLIVPTSAEGEPLPPMPSFVYDILSPLREQMEASIVHVVQPILVQIKSSITQCITKANPKPFEPQGAVPHVCIDTTGDGLPNRVPWLRELEERLDAAYRLLILRVARRCGQDGEAWFISVAIHTIWKGLMTITARSVFSPSSVVEAQFSHTFGRTASAPTSTVLNSLLSGDAAQSKRVPTPTQLAHALRSVGRGPTHRSRRMPGESTTGTHTPESSDDVHAWLGQYALPSDVKNCYVVNPMFVAEQLYNLQVFERLMRQFCTDFIEPNTGRDRFCSLNNQSCPGEDPSDEEDLARAALNEAFGALSSTVIVLRTLLQEPDALLHVTKHRGEHEGCSLSPEAVRAFDVIPSLLLVHIAYCRIPPSWRQSVPSNRDYRDGYHLPNPHELLGFSWSEYEMALSGFGAGEAALATLIARYAPVLDQVLQALSSSCTCSRAEQASMESDEEAPASMVMSAPTLQDRTDMATNAISTGAVDDGVPQRSRSQIRAAKTLSGRIWRRTTPQGRLAPPHALPPHVSMTHATSSITSGRISPPKGEPLLPRSTTMSLSHMQYSAVSMFASILRCASCT